MSLAYQSDSVDERFMDERREEMLDGKIYRMARPSDGHLRADRNIMRIFSSYLVGHRCEVLSEPDVFLTEKDRVVPDIVVFCDPSIFLPNGIHGVPDLIVEILSPSTSKRDRGYKKRLYEKCGVKEYWIVDTRNCSVEVFLLSDGKYESENFYIRPPNWELERMTKEELSQLEYTFKTHLFDDLIIDIREIFEKIGGE
jgi:Uma2 family endonuclease